MRPLYVTLPTLGRDCLRPCMEAMLPQADRVFMVKTGSASVAYEDHPSVELIDAADTPRNISAWWNLGLRAARDAAKNAGATTWDVLVVNDDVMAPPHLASTLSAALRGPREHAGGYVFPGAEPAIACPNQDSHLWHLATDYADPSKLAGYCFMLRGEQGLEADERLVWWYGDTLLDMDARMTGGVIYVPGCRVQHLHPSGYTVADPELTAQTHRDRAVYDSLMRARTDTPRPVHQGSNLGKWAALYRHAGSPQPYADTETYKIGADWLKDCEQIEDWGCGLGWLRNFVDPDRYRGLDGTASPFADEVTDLFSHRRPVAGLFMRHVLEHNHHWVEVLDNALASFTDRMALILFTPMTEHTQEIAPYDNDGIAVPNISFAPADLESRFGDGIRWTVRDLETPSFYGTERVYLLEREA